MFRLPWELPICHNRISVLPTLIAVPAARHTGRFSSLLCKGGRVSIWVRNPPKYLQTFCISSLLDPFPLSGQCYCVTLFVASHSLPAPVTVPAPQHKNRIFPDACSIPCAHLHFSWKTLRASQPLSLPHAWAPRRLKALAPSPTLGCSLLLRPNLCQSGLKPQKTEREMTTPPLPLRAGSNKASNLLLIKQIY